MGSETLHERYEDLTPYTRDMHRAIVSLMEELEAIDWYQQRVDGTQDEELKAVLGHHRDEEIEHAMMIVEWLLRTSPVMAAAARTFLFSKGPITEVEESLKAAVERDRGDQGVSKKKTASPIDHALGIGSLKLA